MSIISKFSTGLIFATGVLCNESLPGKCHRSGISRSKSATLITWFLCGSILSLFYKSQLLSMLATVRHSRPAETSADILSMGMTLSIPVGTSAMAMAKTSPDPNIQKLMKKSSHAHFIMGKVNELNHYTVNIFLPQIIPLP